MINLNYLISYLSLELEAMKKNLQENQQLIYLINSLKTVEIFESYILSFDELI